MSYLAEPCETVIARQQSLTERLQDERSRIQERLDGINRVLDALENNSEVRDILDAMSKLGHIY